jgi:hypothetical protein
MREKLSSYKKKLQDRKIVANAIRQSIHEQYLVFIDQETPWGCLGICVSGFHLIVTRRIKQAFVQHGEI